jgi:hypothetical protein
MFSPVRRPQASIQNSVGIVAVKMRQSRGQRIAEISPQPRQTGTADKQRRVDDQSLDGRMQFGTNAFLSKILRPSASALTGLIPAKKSRPKGG